MELQKEIRKVLARHKEVIAAYLYGSRARGDSHDESDLDLGLLLREDFGPDALYPARISEEIPRVFGSRHELDVRTLNGMPPTFLHQVLKHGVLLYSRDDRKRVAFETRAYDMYLDYKPYFDHYNEVRRRRLLV